MLDLITLPDSIYSWKNRKSHLAHPPRLRGRSDSRPRLAPESRAMIFSFGEPHKGSALCLWSTLELIPD